MRDVDGGLGAGAGNERAADGEQGVVGVEEGGGVCELASDDPDSGVGAGGGGELLGRADVEREVVARFEEGGDEEEADGACCSEYEDVHWMLDDGCWVCMRMGLDVAEGFGGKALGFIL